MWKNLADLSRRDRLAQVVLVVFLLLAAWWLILQFIGYEEVSESRNLIWAATYQLVAVFGGVGGLLVSRGWGGGRSVLGRSILAFAVGLLFQVFGQSTFSFYNLLLKVDIPYPSIADIGFFGSIPLYIYATVLLARASGVAVTLRSFARQIQALAIPLVILVFSYLFFLREYEFDWSEPLRVLLDFGYPFGQAIYISLAILAYLLSKGVLGGVMKGRILFILLALVVQYAADYNFLFQAANETWRNGGYGDFLYMLAYLTMTLGLYQLGVRYIEETKLPK